MPEFLSLVTPQQAMEKVLGTLGKVHPKIEELETTKCLNRVCGETIYSKELSPAFDRSTVDGFAVCADDTFGASETMPMYLKVIDEIPMGKPALITLEQGSACLVHTGGMLPENADAVVMLENTQKTTRDEIEVLRAVSKGENIIRRGEDLDVGDVVIRQGTKTRPIEIGGLLALGINRIKVFKKPVVGILSMGDEVIPAESIPQPGQIRDINSQMLANLVEEFGGTPNICGIVKDDLNELQSILKQVYQKSDIVVVTAGSSVSARDLTATAIAQLGNPGVLVHGINIKPGKPTILAVCGGKPVIGLPGNPISAFVIARLFLIKILLQRSGIERIPEMPVIKAILATNFASQAGRVDYVPVSLENEKKKLVAHPIHFKSNLIFNLTHADGLAIIPADSNGLAAEDSVDVLLL